MREIKFRYWEKPDASVNFEGKMHYASDEYFNKWCGNPEYETMQFTGLLDRHGKEIYEGDILKWSDEYAPLGEYKEHIKKVSWETYYGLGWNFGKSYKDGEKRWSYPAPSPEEVEIIGNIYENPELLVNPKK